MIDISVGILVGGKSSRMGENKARLQYKERTFFETIAQACQNFKNIFVSVDDSRKYQDLPYPLVEDELSAYGPLEGVYQLLKAVPTQYVLVLATDMPLIRSELLEALVQQAIGKEDCIVLCVEGKPQPMCSIYSVNVLPVLKKMREIGEHKPRILYQKVQTKYVNIEDLGFDKSLVDNINTKEELKRILS
jgi:molybdopterin-guanine dinucleotide biosynthesis protein A